MAEIALSALASFGAEAGVATGLGELSGLAAGTGYAVGSTGAAAGGLFSSPVLGILSGAATAVSVMQQLRSGEMTAETYELKSKEATAEGIGVQAEHHGRAARIKKELLATLGENDVAYAASGVDLSYGEAAQRRSRATTDAFGEIAVDRASSDAKTAMYDANALNYDRLARMSRSGAALQAWATGLYSAGRLAYRGFA